VQVLKQFVVPCVLSCAESKSSSVFALGLQLFGALWAFKVLKETDYYPAQPSSNPPQN
jgi:hypothetical protein